MKKIILQIIIVMTVLLVFSACSQESGTIPPESLVLSIRNILEMPAYEQIYHDIVYIGEERKVLFITTSDKKVLFSIDIRIQAGIRNAEQISIEVSTDKDGKRKAAVSLPESEILLADADEKTIEQYFIKERGGEISRLEYYDEINRRKEELIENAIKTGILEQADENIKNLVSGFLLLSDIDEVSFRTAGNEI